MKAGTKLKRAINKEFDVTGVAEEQIDLICRQADELEAMEEQVVKDGLTIAGARGQVVAHPLLPQINRARLALHKMLGDTFGETKRDKALRAAKSRWGG